MNLTKVLFLILCLIQVSCQLDQEKPSDLIEKDQMVLLLKDMMLLEATYNTRLIKLNDKKEKMIQYSDEILEKHAVSKKSFDDSYEYYLDHSTEFEDILELVFEELNKMETEAHKYNAKEVNKDSTLVSE